MRALQRLSIPVVLFLVAVSLFAGCGDTSRNDQGISFSLSGWYQTVDGVRMGVSTIVVPLSDSNDEIRDDQAGGTGGGLVAAEVGLENHLDGQFIRTDRAFHTYFVPGAALQPPSTSVSVPGTLAPASGNVAAEYPEFNPPNTPGTSSSLPASQETLANKMFAGIMIVPPAVRTFINLNREQFPEAPFVMVVTTYVEGVSSSGSRLSTNEIQIEVLWTPDNIVPPTQGGDGGEEASPTPAGVSADEEE